MSFSRPLLVGIAFVAAVLAFDCGGDDESPSPGAKPDGSAGTSGGGNAGVDAGGGSSGSAGTGGSAGTAGNGGSMGADAGTSEPPACVRTCRVAADCAKDGANPPFDANNWACDSGGYCRWLGCLDDSECAFFNGVCRLRFLSSANVKTCTEGCSDVSVCVETLVSVDLDNWSCVEGGCKYTGCKTDDECAADHGAGSKCLPGDPYPSCRKACQKPADCVTTGALPHQDADNWLCRDNLCVYAGCTSDQECSNAEGRPAVCLGR